MPSDRRTEAAVARVHLMDIERGERVVYLEPGDVLDETTGRVEVEALEADDE